MKKILYIAALFLVVSFVACSEGYEQMLLGKWTLQKSEIEDLDSFCEYQSHKTIDELDKQLKLIDMELESADNAHRETLEAHKASILQQKLQYSVDSIRADIQDNIESLFGNFFFTFRTDKSFTLASPNDSVSGIWSLKGDSIISTLISGRPAEDINIISLSDSKMELSTTEIDDEGFALTTRMSFTK